MERLSQGLASNPTSSRKAIPDNYRDAMNPMASSSGASAAGKRPVQKDPTRRTRQTKERESLSQRVEKLYHCHVLEMSVVTKQQAQIRALQRDVKTARAAISLLVQQQGTTVAPPAPAENVGEETKRLFEQLVEARRALVQCLDFADKTQPTREYREFKAFVESEVLGVTPAEAGQRGDMSPINAVDRSDDEVVDEEDDVLLPSENDSEVETEGSLRSQHQEEPAETHRPEQRTTPTSSEDARAMAAADQANQPHDTDEEEIDGDGMINDCLDEVEEELVTTRLALRNVLKIARMGDGAGQKVKVDEYAQLLVDCNVLQSYVLPAELAPIGDDEQIAMAAGGLAEQLHERCWTLQECKNALGSLMKMLQSENKDSSRLDAETARVEQQLLVDS